MNNPMPDLWSASSGERMLQDRIGTRERAQRFYDRQVLGHLSEPMRRFIGLQQMMFLATSDARGACDSTLRTGPPGFVLVLGKRRLAWPEYRGNGVMASRGNITENPHVGLLFVDFVRDVIGLHVNGSAELVDDAEVRQEFPGLPADSVPGRRPEQWVIAHVEEAYIHCAKYIPRLYAEPRDGVHLIHRPRAKKSDYFAATDEVDRHDESPSPDGPSDHSGAAPDGSCADRPPVLRPVTSPSPAGIRRPVPTSPAGAARRPSGTRWRRRLLRSLLRQLRQSW
jgi:predicted pyridoxine 5'-phosphate oxidase superfamily flavin-nucleotide-binding protein